MGDRRNHRLPTRFSRIGVTDDNGVPDTGLPASVSYDVGRSYGRDSQPIKTRLGGVSPLQVETRGRHRKRRIYPANYWLTV